jgi:hypothetical protein
MDHNLSTKKGGTVPEIKTHCRFLQYRPVLIHKSILCSGDGIWEPCPDFELCKNLPPPPVNIYLEPLVTEVFDTAIREESQIQKKKHGRPPKLFFGKIKCI